MSCIIIISSQPHPTPPMLTRRIRKECRCHLRPVDLSGLSGAKTREMMMVRSLPTVPVAYWLVALSPCLTPPNALSSSGQPRAHVLTTHQHITHCYSLALPADGPMETCRARPPAGRLMSGKLRHHTRSLPTGSPRSPETKQPRLRRSVELHCLEWLLVGGWLRSICSACQSRTRAQMT